MRRNEFLAESDWDFDARFPYQYVTRCSDGGHGRMGEAIHDMVDRGREISYRTFMNEVGGAEQMVQVFPMYNWPSVGHRGHGLAMRDDYTMKNAFYRSTWYGLACVYCVWSGIEFIFTKGGITPESEGINRTEYLLNLDLNESLMEQNMAPRGMFAYHATFERNLPGIRQHGLVMDKEPNWDFTRTGRLYGSDHDGADWYSQELGGAFEQPMVIIRFPMPANTTPDELGNHGDFWFRENIAPETIEVEAEPGGRFIPLADYQMALTEVSYEPEHPYQPKIAVPFMDKAFSENKRKGLRELGQIDDYTVMAGPESSGMIEFFLVKDGNPKGEITLTSARGQGERWVSSSFVRPECRGVGYRFYKFILDQGIMLRSGRTHTEDARKLWTKLALDPSVDVRMNYDKEVTTVEDVAMAYESQLYFLTAKKAGLTEAAKFKTKAPDAAWRERVLDWKNSDDTVHDDPVAEKLKRMLLTYGGWAVAGLDDPDRQLIMARGQLWKGRGAYFKKGRPNNCHGNTSALWEANPDSVQIVTGFALSDDGMWRVHTWGLHQGKPVETTVKRVAYFGFVMTDEEAAKFASDNDF